MIDFENMKLPKYVKKLKRFCADYDIRFEIDGDDKNFYYSSLDVKDDEAVSGLISLLEKINLNNPSWKIENSF